MSVSLESVCCGFPSSLSLVPAHQEEKTHTDCCTVFPYRSEQTLAGAPTTHSATMMLSAATNRTKQTWSGASELRAKINLPG